MTNLDEKKLHVGENLENQSNFISFIIIGAGLVNIAIAAFTNTWAVSLFGGGIPIIVYLLLKYFSSQKPSFKYFTSILLAIEGGTIIYQSKNYFVLYFFVLILISSLILFKEWRVFIPYVVIITSFAFVNFYLQQKIDDANATTPTDIWPLIIYVALLLLFAILCGFLAEYLGSITKQKNELNDQLVKLQDYEESNIEFARQISSGNFDVKYSLKENDILGHSLIEMSKNLKQAAVEEKQRNWSVEGIANIADILRVNHENIDELAFNVISHLVKYTKANQGAIFILNDDDKQNMFLELKGCYAYERRKFVEKTVEIGQGLVGQAYLEKELIYMTDIPENYIQITSGLGDATPRSLIIVPIKMEDQVIGILELASFNDFQSHERMFLEKVSENVASAIISSKVKDQTTQLLKASQEMTEQMRAQEEEMRQNMEELQATQENLQRESKEKEKVQQEITKTRDFLQSIINAIPDPVFVKDSQHRMLIVNDAVCKLNNWERKDVIGKTDFDFFPPEEAQVMFDNEEKIFASKGSVEEIMQATRNGKTTFVVDKKRIVENEYGELFLVGTNNDITDLKQVEEQLAKEKYLLDALMKNATDSIYFKDINSKFIRISDNMLSVFKVNSQQEMTGKSDFDFFTEEHAKPAFDAEQEIIRTGKPILNLIEKETWDDGRVTYVSTSKMPLRDLEGNIVGTFGISRDVTDSRKIELELQNSENRMKAVLNYVSECIVMTDLHKEIQFVTQYFSQMLDYDENELMGKALVELIHKDDKQAFEKALGQLRSEKESKIVVRYQSKSGGYHKKETLVVNAMVEGNINGIVFKILN